MLMLGTQLRKKRNPNGDGPAFTAEEIRVQLENEFANFLSGETTENCLNPLLGMPGM